jgi:hypothetical protein
MSKFFRSYLVNTENHRSLLTGFIHDSPYSLVENGKYNGKKNTDNWLENRNVVRFHLKSGRLSVGRFDGSNKHVNRNQSRFGAVPVPKSVTHDFPVRSDQKSSQDSGHIDCLT